MRRLARDRRRGEAGFTLIEVIVSLAIVAFSMITLMTILGQATDDVMETIRRRKMRYLAQIIIADIEVGKISPDEEEERYEEGTTGSFADWSSPDDPEEYAAFEYQVKVLRDVPVVGAAAADESLEDSGWELDADGRPLGRPVSNDLLGSDGAEDEEAPPEGQIKRQLVLIVRSLGEEADDDVEFEIMTYLPYPGEEDQPLGAGAAAGAEGAPAGPGGADGGGQPREAGGRSDEGGK